MRFVIMLFVLGMAHAQVNAQDNYYKKSKQATAEQKPDSALIYINKAISGYKTQNKRDSLVFAYIEKTQILWYDKGLEAGFQTIDTALAYSALLPRASLAHVAALDKKGQLHVHNSESAKAKQYMLEALSYVKPGTADDVYAALYNNLAWLYLELQDFGPASIYAHRARRMVEKLHGKDSKPMVNVLQTLTYISHDASKLDEALKYALELYRLAKIHYAPTHPTIGLVHNELGTIYQSLGQYEEAIFHRRQMVEIVHKDYLKKGNPQLLAMAYNNMGFLYNALSEYYLAHEYFVKAQKLHEKNYGADGPGIVRPITHLADIKRHLGMYTEAGILFERAYKLQNKNDSKDFLNLAYVETHYGDLFFELGNYKKAEEFYKKAILHNEAAGLGDTKITIMSRATLGDTYARTNRTDEALQLQQQALKAYQKMYPPGHIVIAGQFNRISKTWLIAGKLPQAAQYSDSVFMHLTGAKQLSAKAEWVDQLPFDFNVLQYLQHRAEVKQKQYQVTGQAPYLNQLLLLAEAFGNFTEKNLSAFRTQTSLINLAGVNKSVYAAAIEACWALYQKDKNPARLINAFNYTERGKALLLRLAVNNMMVSSSGKAGDAHGKRDRSFLKQINALNSKYLNQETGNDTILSLLSKKMEAYRAFQDSLIEKGNPLALTKYRLTPYPLKEIREKLLRRNESLLQFAVTDHSVFTFLVTTDDFKVYRTSRKVLDKVKQLDKLNNLSADEFIKISYSLYQQLIKPAEAHFVSNKLLIIPDAELYYLNFELLPRSNQKADYKSIPYLIHKYDISYLLSAASAIQFKNALKNRKQDKAMLLAPVFTDEMKKKYQKEVPAHGLTDEVYLKLLRQPFSLSAVNQIAKYIRSELFTKQQAQESTFKEKASGFRILHFGTHAEINNSSPLQSGLFFAKASVNDSTNQDDGYLHAYEIYAMQLKAELAVLTACETGNGTWHNGAGVVSLAHSFMYAGCPSVVMSLWKIDEKTSSNIITGFYQHLADGDTKSGALRKAKLDFLKTSGPELANPYYWAGLALIGDPSPVYSSGYGWWLYLGLLLVALTLFWLIYLRKKKRQNPGT